MPLSSHRLRLSLPQTLLHLGLTGGLAATAVVGVAASGSASPATGTTVLPRMSDTAVTIPTLPDLHGLLTIGSRGSDVRLAQGQLGVATDGIFGPITRGAVVRFQSSRGLAVDGIIGPVTWAALARSAPTTSHASAHPLLSRGDRGGAVADVQRRLEISADGVFGPVTLSAVRAFQSAHGLVVDGVVGSHTWSALERVGSWHYGGGSASLSSNASTYSVGTRAVQLASQQAGVPYVYGGASPAGFDCSGLVKYVFGQLGYSLPHNADMQYHAVRHVAKSNLQVGDIVFMPNSRGYITHDGIYAGNGYWWVAPHTGEVVQKQRIYTSRYLVGRVG